MSLSRRGSNVAGAVAPPLFYTAKNQIIAVTAFNRVIAVSCVYQVGVFSAVNNVGIVCSLYHVILRLAFQFFEDFELGRIT